MKRYILALAIVAIPAQAFEWPWQHRTIADYGFCKGFVSAGLGAFPVENLSRTQLWLAWNRINRANLFQGSITQQDYQAGQKRFASLLAAGDAGSLLQVADGDCGLGRN